MLEAKRMTRSGQSGQGHVSTVPDPYALARGDDKCLGAAGTECQNHKKIKSACCISSQILCTLSYSTGVNLEYVIMKLRHGLYASLLG
jgi:hypothetical protein